jgi:hypothetical protein
MEQQKETEFMMMAMAFPTLREAEGVTPWNPNRLDIWAAEEADSPEAIAAAQFLLSQWNPGCQWECGRFNPQQAFRYWDSPHRLAYLEWASRDSSVN